MLACLVLIIHLKLEECQKNIDTVYLVEDNQKISASYKVPWLKLHKRETFVGYNFEFCTFFKVLKEEKLIWTLPKKIQSFRAY